MNLSLACPWKGPKCGTTQHFRTKCKSITTIEKIFPKILACVSLSSFLLNPNHYLFFCFLAVSMLVFVIRRVVLIVIAHVLACPLSSSFLRSLPPSFFLPSIHRTFSSNFVIFIIQQQHQLESLLSVCLPASLCFSPLPLPLPSFSLPY